MIGSPGTNATSRHLVVSAVNFSEGGPLTVLVEGLDAAASTLGEEWRITALVHDETLITNERVETIAYPQSKTSWIRRLRLEWWSFGALSRELKPDLWVSLHDMTPRVVARRQAVYCHNPSPFYRASLTEARFDPRFFLFNKLYMQLYKLFIRRNFAVIVQQSWLRDAFCKATRHPNIVVAYPGDGSARDVITKPVGASGLRRPTADNPLRLLYPSLPRVFKNMEVLCEAVIRLPDAARRLVELRLTLDGSENAWAQEILRRYGNVPGLSFIGRQDRASMTREYEACDAVLFPSRLETWGLPISEAKSFRKPLLVADLPYASETVGTYTDVSFVAADDAAMWADRIARMASGTWVPDGHVAVTPEQPFVSDWPSLWRYLTDGL